VSGSDNPDPHEEDQQNKQTNDYISHDISPFFLLSIYA